MNPAELSTFVAALAGALWLGLLTAISPCPLATNIAAIGYVARFSQRGNKNHAWLPGLLYALGRAVAYTVVGGVITWGLLSAPSLSSFLQKHMNQLLGPLLVLVGMALLGMLPGLPSFGKGGGQGFNEKLMSFGLFGCALMGFVFALTFCPVSAALFFGSLLPLTVKEQSAWLVPALFGIGSAAPVLVFALALAVSREAAGRASQRLQSAQRWIAPASGWLLVAIGVWMCLHLTLRLF
jgi:cytochrome c biogenesis protein CcdA